MPTRAFDLAGPAGRLEAVLMTPAKEPSGSVLLCHAHPLHGGTMHFKLLFRVAKAIERSGLAVLRFHFRGVGRSVGEHDHGRGELDDARAALDFLERELPAAPIVLGGFSFGALVALRVAMSDERAAAAIALGLPVAVIDVPNENPSRKPVFFVQGQRDEFGDESAIRRFVTSFPGPSELFVVPAVGHLFDDETEAVATAVAEWLHRATELRLPRSPE